MKKCPHCGKNNSAKYGLRKNKSGFVQKYFCKSCKKSFTPRKGFENMQTKPEMVVIALDLRAKGMSLGKIQMHLLQNYKFKVTRSTILYWQKKFGEMIDNFTKQFTLISSENAHADEVFLRFKGSGKQEFIYYWDCIDYDTKFLVGDHISNARTEEHAFEFLEKVKNQIQKPPNTIHTDCSFDYPRPVKKVFQRKTLHKTSQAWKKKFKNNPIERFHNTLKENYKIMRHFNSIKTAYQYLTFFRNYYNFIRLHKSLGWQTPAEAAGFTKYNWFSIIRD